MFAAATLVVVMAAGLAVVSSVTAPDAGASAMMGVSARVLIAYSVQHRPIYAYRMGDPASALKGVIVGQMHGDEPAGVTITDTILHGQPVHGIDLWVVPSINPDGYAAHRRQNAHGVDLNRNWPNNWASLTGAYYSGTKPLSEPETAGLYAFLNRVKPTYLVSLHQPLDGVDTTDGGARDPAFRHRLSANLGLPEKALTCWSVCEGSMTGWLTNDQSGSAITVEFGSTPSHSYLVNTAASGILSALSVRYGRPLTAGAATPALLTGRLVGAGGWNSFDQIALADLDDDQRADLIATNARHRSATRDGKA